MSSAQSLRNHRLYSCPKRKETLVVKCPWCPKEYTNESSLRAHKKVCASKPPEQLEVCPECIEEVPARSLEHHMRSHRKQTVTKVSIQQQVDQSMEHVLAIEGQGVWTDENEQETLQEVRKSTFGTLAIEAPPQDAELREKLAKEFKEYVPRWYMKVLEKANKYDLMTPEEKEAEEVQEVEEREEEEEEEEDDKEEEGEEGEEGEKEKEEEEEEEVEPVVDNS